MRRITLLLTAALIQAGVLGDHAGAQTKSSGASPVDIREWQVPWENSRPRDPYVGPRDRVWFVGQRGDYVGVLDPESGEFRKYDLEEGVGPHTLIVGGDGTIWYAGNRAAHIGKLDPETGRIHKIPTEVQDPHTLVWNQEGDIWFTAQGANQIAKMNTRTEEIRYYPVPTERARPYGIIMDRDEADRPWVVLLGTNKLATVDPGSDELREIEIPDEGARPRRLVMTSDGTIWFADYAEGKLWSYVPESGAFESRELPGGADSRPYGMAVDRSDRIWIVETGVSANQFVGFDPATGQFFGRTPIPSGGGAVRNMMYDAADGEVWFGTDTNYIGRARVR